MTYSIGEVAKKTGLTTHTLRYYDKEGLLPKIKKSASGIRYFTDDDLLNILILECLKSTGLSLKQIKHYFDLCKMGTKTLNERLEIFYAQRAHLEQEMKNIRENLKRIDFKIRYYKEYIKSGVNPTLDKKSPLSKEKQTLFKLKID